MRVLVTGGRGLLGSDLIPELTRRGHEVISPSHDEFDITDPMSVAKLAIGELGKFDACINCAAYTAVDKAESEPDAAYDVNGYAVGLLAGACQANGAKLLHISTDFVFDGSASEPYREEAPTNPLGAYGRSKFAGEQALAGRHDAWVVRTSWVFGKNGPCFPRSILNAYRAGKTLRVVADQVGSPTSTVDLSRVLVDFIERNPFPGTYHAVGPESMSWHEFAERVLSAAEGKPITIEAIPSREYPTPAKRPAYSVLSTKKLEALGVEPMRPVDAAIAEWLA